MTSVTRASAMVSTAAATSSVRNTVWMASKIGLPSPSGATEAAIVASEITVTAATRTPAMIEGRASGSRIRKRIWFGVSPIPSAASTALRGTVRSPVSVLRNSSSNV